MRKSHPVQITSGLQHRLCVDAAAVIPDNNSQLVRSIMQLQLGGARSRVAEGIHKFPSDAINISPVFSAQLGAERPVNRFASLKLYKFVPVA